MNRLLEKLSLSPDLARGLRGVTAFSGALLVCALLGQPLSAQFVAPTALNMSLVQLRGAYHIRGMILAGMILVLTGAASLGAVSSGNTIAAVVSIGVLALLSGVWRQLSADYGASLGVGSALLFLLGLSGSLHGATAVQIAAWTACGGAVAAVLHLGLWLFRPQHALRHAVAESWVAASDLFLSFRPEANGTGAERATQKQRSLRETLDRTSGALSAADFRSRTPLVAHLNRMRHEAAHFAMQVVALHTASEPLLTDEASLHHGPTFDSLMKELANMARAVAVALIAHRRENLAIACARIHTCERLIQVLSEELSASDAAEAAVTQARRLLGSMTAELGTIRSALAETVSPPVAEIPSPSSIPDLNERSMRQLARDFHPSRFRLDPVLLRYSTRMAVVSMAGVAIYLGFALPRGYWLPLAMIVVLQPDYGSTRQRAFHRVGGTLAGALLGSALIASPMPIWLLSALAGVTAFGFAYFLRRSYGTAVFFVTLMLVLLTELHAPVHLDFTISRLVANAAGAAAALIAALFFWPSWEREKLPSLLGKAIRANRDYFAAVSEQLTAGEGLTSKVIRAKQEAERAGNIAAASLQRMQAEPRREQESPGRLGALITFNQRVTTAITVLGTHLGDTSPPLSERNTQLATAIHDALDRLANEGSEAPLSVDGHDSTGVSVCADGSDSVCWSLEKISTEVRAMLLAAHGEAEESSQARIS